MAAATGSAPDPRRGYSALERPHEGSQPLPTRPSANVSADALAFQGSAGGPTASRGALRVLWIDDEPAILAPAVRLLREHGIHVDSAGDGTTGLALATAGRYGVILLDLKLPEMWGTEVLRALRANGVTTPVVLLTGCDPDADGRVMARLGASIHRKPLYGNSLLHVVRAHAEDAPTASPLFRKLDGFPSAECARLIEGLRLTPVDPLLAADAGSVRKWLLWLASAMAGDVTVLEFLELVRAFSVLADGRAVSLKLLMKRLSQKLLTASRPGAAADDLVRVTNRLEAAGAGWRTVTSAAIAAEIGITEDLLGPSLRAATGLSFRECRRLVAMRRAILELAMTREHVDQIAYGLGYEQKSALNRDFKDVLRTTPKAYRALVSGFVAPPVH